MNIILVSERLAKARTITLGLPQVFLLGLGALVTIIMLAGFMHQVLMQLADHLKLPNTTRPLSVSAQPRLQSHREDAHESAQSYMRENLSVMAVRLGQMQAQLLRLDTLGERLAKIAGFKPQELMFDRIPGQGGAVSTLPSQELSLGDLTRQLDLLSRQMDDRGDKLGLLESLFLRDRAKKKLTPTMMPVAGGWDSSNYGWRIDPFTGQRAFHEGIDFMAEKGTPIVAAAGGVVVYSGFHPQYGKMVEIDHGNGLTTRYAHASKLLVKVGDVVMMGTKIAEVGKTGRATGTHLHFEVRLHGVPRNPARFLRLHG